MQLGDRTVQFPVGLGGKTSADSSQQEARQWIADALPPQWGEIQSIEIVKERPWSTVLRVITEGGIAYFKACNANGAHEISLLQWLQSDYSMNIPDLLAVDESSGWVLMADAGISLREGAEEGDRPPLVATLIPEYARLQQQSIGKLKSLLDMGIPDRRLAQLPRLFNALIRGWANRIDKELQSALTSSLPTVEWLCESLSSTSYSAALDHGDLHTGNILMQDGQSRLCDWGDACITHPFCSLMPLLEKATNGDLLSKTNVTAARLRDVYLEVWTKFAPIEVLRHEFYHVMGLSYILRALDIAYMLDGADGRSLDHWGRSVSQQLSRWVAVEKTFCPSALC